MKSQKWKNVRNQPVDDTEWPLLSGAAHEFVVQKMAAVIRHISPVWPFVGVLPLFTDELFALETKRGEAAGCVLLWSTVT